MSIKSKIQALITAANAKTGESDTTLTDAVQTLVDGYGQGGGGYSYIEHYQYVQAETKDYNSGGFTSWFVNTYITKGNGLYWGKITDVTDNPSQYKAVAFYAFKTADNGISSAFKRPVNWICSINNEASFYVYSGGIVDIWFIPETYFNS